ncbi:MAG: hypothetical protein OEL83_12290 [Desulforhopalus sp.]|nr:hypothetical protein [Desulforhopalus sp.]
MTPTDRTAYEYSFLLPDLRCITFSVIIDPLSHEIATCPIIAPAWARLEFHQCAPCTLKVEEHPYCPVALSISDLVTTFKATPSHVECTVSCRSPDRTVMKETKIQEGLTSILGLLIAISGCPIMEFFKPLARFHLPFATVDESIFRIVAMYMLRKYYQNEGMVRDHFSLGDIKDHYALVRLVNKGIFDRVHSVTQFDADKNAIITLNSLGQILEMEIDSNLESLAHLFKPQ